MINSNLKEEKLTCKSGGGTSYLLFTAGKTNVCCFENDPVVYDSVQNRFVCGPRNLIYTSILDKVPREINLGYTFKSGSNAGNNLGYEEMPGYFPVSRSQDQMISYIAVRSRVMKAVLDKDTINKLKAFKPKLTVDYVDENDKLVAPSKIAECQIEKIPVDNTQEMVIFYRCDVQPFSLGADFRGYKIRFRAYVQNYRYAKEQKKEDLSIGSNFDVISWFNYYFIKEKQNQPDWGKTASYYYALLDKLAVPTKIDTVENGKILAGKPVYIDWKNSKSKVSDYAPRVDSLVGDEKINVCNQTLNPTSYIYNYYIKSRPPKIQSSFGLNYNNDMDFLVWDTYLDEAQKCDKDWYDYAQEALTQPGKDLGRIVSTPVLHMIALASKVEPEKTVQKVEKVTEYATVGGAVVGVLKIFPAGAKTVVGVIGIPVSWVYENVFKKAAGYLGLGETRGSLADLGELKYGDVIRSDAVGDKAVIEALARNYGECSQRTLGEFDKDLQAHGCTVKFPNCCQEGETSKYVGAVVRTLSRTSIFGFGMGKLYDALNINEKIFNLCGKEDSCKGAPYNIGLPTLPPYYATGNVENSELVYINKDLGKGPFTNKAIVYPDLVKKLNAASKKT